MWSINEIEQCPKLHIPPVSTSHILITPFSKPVARSSLDDSLSRDAAFSPGAGVFDGRGPNASPHTVWPQFRVLSCLLLSRAISTLLTLYGQALTVNKWRIKLKSCWWITSRPSNEEGEEARKNIWKEGRMEGRRNIYRPIVFKGSTYLSCRSGQAITHTIPCPMDHANQDRSIWREINAPRLAASAPLQRWRVGGFQFQYQPIGSCERREVRI